MLLTKFYNHFRFPFALLIAFSITLQTSVFAQDDAQDAPAQAAAESTAAADPAVAQGEAVFKANCTQCHAFDQVVVGPALRNAHQNWGSDAELAKFIKYPQRVIESGNKHAVALYNQYKQFMPNHDFLSDEEINAVIAYIKAGPSQAAASPDAGTITGRQEQDHSTAFGNEMLIIVIAGLVFVLFLVVLVLILVLSVLTRYVDKKEDIDPEDREVATARTDWGAIASSNVFRGIVGFIFVLVLLKVAFDQVYGIGIQQGYAPKQPIAFSHKLHAGMYEIDCNYCHTGVNKGKSANIPSANICMNCHNSIKTESPEIKKIWAALENDTPIEWVRVHNLPDLAYFNHAQHVNVGGIECQTCHGAIQEMEVVKQHSTLTMGWCINCHRETVVRTEGNAYYDRLVQLHNDSKGGPMKVENIGGLECSKCHY